MHIFLIPFIFGYLVGEYLKWGKRWKEKTMFSSDEARTSLMNIFPSPPHIATISVSKKKLWRAVLSAVGKHQMTSLPEKISYSHSWALLLVIKKLRKRSFDELYTTPVLPAVGERGRKGGGVPLQTLKRFTSWNLQEIKKNRTLFFFLKRKKST